MHLSIYLSIYPFLYPSIQASTQPPIHPSVASLIHPYARPPIHQSNYPSAHPIHPSIRKLTYRFTNPILPSTFSTCLSAPSLPSHPSQKVSLEHSRTNVAKRHLATFYETINKVPPPPSRELRKPASATSRCPAPRSSQNSAGSVSRAGAPRSYTISDANGWRRATSQPHARERPLTRSTSAEGSRKVPSKVPSAYKNIRPRVYDHVQSFSTEKVKLNTEKAPSRSRLPSKPGSRTSRSEEELRRGRSAPAGLRGKGASAPSAVPRKTQPPPAKPSPDYSSDEAEEGTLAAAKASFGVAGKKPTVSADGSCRSAAVSPTAPVTPPKEKDPSKERLRANESPTPSISNSIKEHMSSDIPARTLEGQLSGVNLLRQAGFESGIV